jgi:hypothetical protein
MNQSTKYGWLQENGNTGNITRIESMVITGEQLRGVLI